MSDIYIRNTSITFAHYTYICGFAFPLISAMLLGQYIVSPLVRCMFTIKCFKLLYKDLNIFKLYIHRCDVESFSVRTRTAVFSIIVYYSKLVYMRGACINII